MMPRRLYCFIACVLGLSLTAQAKPAEEIGPAAAKTPAAHAAALTELLRPLILQSLPTPLHQKSDSWGATKRTPNGLRWRGQGPNVRPELQFAEKNHGHWKRTQILAEGLPGSFVFQIQDLRASSPDCRTFDVYVGMPLRIIHDEQRWESGVKLYDFQVRCRLRALALLRCETRLTIESTGGWLPEVAYRFQVMQVQVGYDQVSFDHVAGLGGEAAEQLGRLGLAVVRQARPSLEHGMRERLEAALLKAATKKELKVSTSQLWNVK